MAQDSFGQKFELALRAGPAEERISHLFARAHSRNGEARIQKKTICALLLYCDVPKPMENETPSKCRLDSGMMHFMAEQAKRAPAISPGRRYLLLYSGVSGRLAGPVGEATDGEEPQCAMGRTAKERLNLSDSEISEIFPFSSVSQEKEDISFFSLALPYARLSEIVSGINNTNPAHHLGANDFFFAALVRRSYFLGEYMSVAYPQPFPGIIEMLESVRKPI
jgi:hypothetical protein